METETETDRGAGADVGVAVEGLDSEGRTFSNTKEMWAEEIGQDGQADIKEWYNKGVGYWQQVEASVDGVLGGYGHVSGRDVRDSNAFLVEIMGKRLREAGHHLVALDCGAGVGRVTENLLLKHFHEVDLVEPVLHFLESAREKLKAANQSKSETHRAANFYCTPLQDFTPEAGRYDVIWVQWCIGHLTDADFVAFFNRAKAGLKPGGFFVLKENIARNGFVLDKEDHSVTRSDAYIQELFSQTGLYLYKTKAQKGFPKELFPVKMYALTTDPPSIVQDLPQQRRSKRETNKPCIIR
uniref:Alpha N-terminal protein methyltransferase 1 n=1 Tax=Araucaria cunninghamii TaxID=56994 RepID=A0A0D6R484_ARACU